MAGVVRPGPALEPLEAAARLGGLPGRFLLHSGSGDDGLGGWSFVGAAPARVLTAHEGEPGAAFLAAVDAALAAAEARAAAPDDDPGAPHPLLIGYLAYDLGVALEPRAAGPRSASAGSAPAAAPTAWLGVFDAIWRRGPDGRCELVGEPAAVAALEAALAKPRALGRPPALGPLAPTAPDAAHLAAVARALDYIGAGDVYQVNLARRLRAPVLADGDALALYAALDAAAPAPYGALVEAEGARVLSGSPERFLARAPGGTRVETRPIKGTRARGATPAADAALAAELAASEKERAEHLMIVDLLRNDLGRVAALGSVRVDDFARVVSLPTVHHLVSTISAVPRPGTSAGALLAATFPGGSITGAPKIRAMQIIDELEPARRGVYTGALGYLGARGAIDLAIAIRTAVLAEGALELWVGGGIVADSEPRRELEETEEKAAGWRRALAARGA